MKIKQLVNLMAASSLMLSTSAFAAGMTFGNNNQAEQDNQQAGQSAREVFGGILSGAKSLQDGITKGLAGFLEPTQTAQAGDGSNTGINGTILKDIFLNEPYVDHETTPYPRVAFTIHSYPELDHGETYGCWNISAVLWKDGNVRVDVPRFDWCAPRDTAYDVSFANFQLWMNHPVFSPQEHTGSKRTVGPTPPEKAAPTHPRYHKIYKMPNLSTMNGHGWMFGALLYQMGFDWGVRDDRRVWIVDFEPARVM